jgi:hypothetical protein
VRDAALECEKDSAWPSGFPFGWSPRGDLIGLCSYCLRLFGQKKTTRATCSNRELGVVRRFSLRFAGCCSRTGSQVMRVSDFWLWARCVSMRDAFCLGWVGGDNGWSPRGRPLRRMVSPGSLGIDERHGRRGFVDALDCASQARIIDSFSVCVRCATWKKLPTFEPRLVGLCAIPLVWRFRALVGLNRDSNLVDSASSIRLSQRLSHACLSINKSIL